MELHTRVAASAFPAILTFTPQPISGAMHTPAADGEAARWDLRCQEILGLLGCTGSTLLDKYCLNSQVDQKDSWILEMDAVSKECH
mmetsp:Transcript_123891/g.231850  ORF Transcript_123891/g.231850 Transcript_123891/m.231850 type:complete len:86 (+) Transcript_123891:531-788(+)